MGFPNGTVTFLFTNIEGSTQLWEKHPEAMRAALKRHDFLVRDAIENLDKSSDISSDNGYAGVIFKALGDGFCMAFPTAPAALHAAIDVQRTLLAENWPDEIVVRVRMAIHTGTVELRNNDYFGQPLNRVARLLAAGHGGQILLSNAASSLVRDTLPSDIGLKALGEYRLQDLGRPEPIF